MQKILESQHASRVPDKELTPTPGKVWYWVPHFDVYHLKKPDQVRVVFDCSALYNSQSLDKNLLQGPAQLNNYLIGVLTRFWKEDVALTCDMEQMFHSFHVTPNHWDFLRFLCFDNNDLAHLFGAVSSPAVANYSLHKTAESGRAEFGDKAADFLCRNFYVDDGLTSVPTISEAIELIEDSQALCASAKFTTSQVRQQPKGCLRGPSKRRPCKRPQGSWSSPRCSTNPAISWHLLVHRIGYFRLPLRTEE